MQGIQPRVHSTITSLCCYLMSNGNIMNVYAHQWEQRKEPHAVCHCLLRIKRVFFPATLIGQLSCSLRHSHWGIARGSRLHFSFAICHKISINWINLRKAQLQMRSKRESGCNLRIQLQLHLLQLYLQLQFSSRVWWLSLQWPLQCHQGEQSEQQQMRQTARLQAASACQLPGRCGLCHTGVTCIESEALGCISVGCWCFCSWRRCHFHSPFPRPPPILHFPQLPVRGCRRCLRPA